MDTTAAVETLKSLSYRPGWNFDAIAPFSAEGEESGTAAMARLAMGDDLPRSLVLFRWELDTVDTNKEFAREGYREPKELQDVVPLDADDFETREDLLFAIFNMIMRLELHEAQEFFRCKDQGWEAPFHPHKAEGQELWERCMARAEQDETN